MKKLALITVLILLIIILIKYNLNNFPLNFNNQNQAKIWRINSIDTMKFSRDLAKLEENKPSFDEVIDQQVKTIADSGANYIALGTPYDNEFVPFMTRWVNSARKYNLKVWFRGNFSGWEGWFDYQRIGRDEHKSLLKNFIVNNPDLFEDGDIFTSCTECENGGPGDPRQTGDIDGSRQFLIDEYQISNDSFSFLKKKVSASYFSMNADVASLIMDKPTTKALGGIVTIDHYVSTPEDFENTINDLVRSSGGKIMIGEFGAPILEINGDMTDQEQAVWIDNVMSKLLTNNNVIGVNYWTGFGGSTQLWNGDGTPKMAVGSIKKYFSPNILKGIIVNETGKGINNAKISVENKQVVSQDNGQFLLPYLNNSSKISIIANGYHPTQIDIPNIQKPLVITLKSTSENALFRLQKLLYKIVNF